MLIGKNRKSFVNKYMSSSSIKSKRQLRKYLTNVNCLIVDTDALITDKLTLVETWSTSLNKPRLLEIANSALYVTKNSSLKHISDCLPHESTINFPPISTKHNMHVNLATWHAGSIYKNYWFGSLNQILIRSKLTDTEREQIILRARKAMSSGYITYAVGFSTSKQLAELSDKNIEDVGLVILKPRLHAGVVGVIKEIYDRKINIIYASGNDEYAVTTIAHLTKLASKDILAISLTQARINSIKNKLYSNATNALKVKLYQKLPSDKTIIVDQPLPEFWSELNQSIASFLD